MARALAFKIGLYLVVWRCATVKMREASRPEQKHKRRETKEGLCDLRPVETGERCCAREVIGLVAEYTVVRLVDKEGVVVRSIDNRCQHHQQSEQA